MTRDHQIFAGSLRLAPVDTERRLLPVAGPELLMTR